MNVHIALETFTLFASPLSAYLVFRYLKDHVRVLHEDMRKLITDSATITRKTVYSVQEDLSKVSLKDHGDTRVFEKQLADKVLDATNDAAYKVLAATNDAKEVIRSEAYIIASDVKATVHQTSAIMHKSFADSVASIEAKTVQATRERLDRPTPVISCSKCGCNVVRHENGVCFTCLKKG